MLKNFLDKCTVLVVLMITSLTTFSQFNFRTVIPQHAVIAGESFQVQFIIEDGGKISNFTPPAFKGFRFVTGPNTYTGSAVEEGDIKQFTNFVYTIAATKNGKFIIPGAVATINGKKARSNDVFIQVISKDEAVRITKRGQLALNTESEYFLRPGEDPLEKIKRNLFLKVFVDRRTCFVGEPLVATFKLYSRLESRSDIVKNPGFYGFGVHDMINLDDKVRTTEMVNGRPFEVHTIRKVQLYPLQPGTFIIDAMELENKVEFSRSAVNKHTEQEIVEGMYGAAEKNEIHDNTEMFETSMKTETVPVKVKPLPAAHAHGFSGAVGDFKIKAAIEKDKLKKNEESSLVITVEGSGNFTQLGAPDIIWPAGIEAFEPAVKETLDKSYVPLQGTKIFRYPFVSSKPGAYTINPVTLSFFNLKNKTYQTVSTQPVYLTVSYQAENKKRKILPAITASSANWFMWLLPAVIVISLVVILYVVYLKKEKRKQFIAQAKQTKSIPFPDDVVLAAERLIAADNKSFYAELNNVLWKHFAKKLQVSGSQINKLLLVEKLTAAGVHPNLTNELISILKECETCMYATAEAGINKAACFEKARHILIKIQEQMPA